MAFAKNQTLVLNDSPSLFEPLLSIHVEKVKMRFFFFCISEEFNLNFCTQSAVEKEEEEEGRGL